MTPYKMLDFVYESVNFEKLSRIWAKFLQNLEKFGDFAQNLTKTDPIGI